MSNNVIENTLENQMMGNINTEICENINLVNYKLFIKRGFIQIWFSCVVINVSAITRKFWKLIFAHAYMNNLWENLVVPINMLYTKSRMKTIKLYFKIIWENRWFFQKQRKLNEIIEPSHRRLNIILGTFCAAQHRVIF